MGAIESNGDIVYHLAYEIEIKNDCGEATLSIINVCNTVHYLN